MELAALHLRKLQPYVSIHNIGNMTLLQNPIVCGRLMVLGGKPARDWTRPGPLFRVKGNSNRQISHTWTTRKAIKDTGFDNPSDGKHEKVESGIQQADLDLAAEVKAYVEFLQLDEGNGEQHERLIKCGQQLLNEVSLSVSGEQEKSAGHVFEARLKRLTMENFFGVHGKVQIGFSQDIPPGLTFIAGDNGSGKSTIFEAVAWCLFGACLRGRIRVDDVVNAVADKDCCVRLDFANGYSITRYRKHKTYGNHTVVEREGSPLRQEDLQQPAVNALLGINMERFARTLVLGGESTGFLAANTLQRRALIESVLDLAELEPCYQEARSLVKSYDDEISVATAKKQTLDKQMRDLQESVRKLADAKQNLEETGRGHRPRQIQKEIAALTEKIQSAEADEDILARQQALLRNKLDRLQTEQDVHAFWEAAFSKKKQLKSSLLSSSSASTIATFRQFVLARKLGSLNNLAAQFLRALYKDTHHARNKESFAATGSMLHSLLLDADDDGGEPRDSHASVAMTPGLLDSSLAIGSALDYVKRSSGERKRIDLAVYFALLATSQSHGAHRSHYLLVDEAFDSLDAAGLTAVLGLLQKSVPMTHVLVTTHNRAIVAKETSDGEGEAITVIRVRMGPHGTEFEKDGKMIGRGE